MQLLRPQKLLSKKIVVSKMLLATLRWKPRVAQVIQTVILGLEACLHAQHFVYPFYVSCSFPLSCSCLGTTDNMKPVSS